MPGTGPSPVSPGPWHVAQPRDAASPFLRLPIGAYATKPDRGSRRISVRSGFSGVSTMRVPIGSVPPPSIGTQMPPRLTIFGTFAVSTTCTHGDHGIAPKYSAAALISSGVIAFAYPAIRFVFAFRDSELLR